MTKKIKNTGEFPISFYGGQVAGCCGTMTFSGFKQEHKREVGCSWPPKYETYDRMSQEEIMKKFDEDILKEVKEKIHRTRTKGEQVAFISLITKYKKRQKGQLDGLAEHLPKAGWTVLKTWINTNTGNELTMYMRAFSSEDFPRKSRKKVEVAECAEIPPV